MSITCYGHGGGPCLSKTGNGDAGLWEGNKKNTVCRMGSISQCTP